MMNKFSKSPLSFSGRLQQGFTLIEILIAVLILAVGLLGFAALQISAVSAGQESYFRSQASLIAESLADRMRANRDYLLWDSRATLTGTGVADQNLYAVPTGTNYTCAAPPVPFCSDDQGVNAGLCTEQQLAAFDVYQACLDAQQLLPGTNGGRVTVVCNDVDETLPVYANKPNPYQGLNHPNFLGTPAILNGADNDACSPGSRYSIFVGWEANAIRQDTGELSQSLSARCQQAPPAGPGFPAGVQCVMLEVIP